MKPSEELARRIRVKIETEYGCGKVGKPGSPRRGYRQAATEIGIAYNRLWRLAHPSQRQAKGKVYFKDVPLDLAHAVCGWLGCSLASLDSRPAATCWADVEKVMEDARCKPETVAAARAVEFCS